MIDLNLETLTPWLYAAIGLFLVVVGLFRDHMPTWIFTLVAIIGAGMALFHGLELYKTYVAKRIA
jgi:hypothetical protein